jgi:hypothetical protein
MHLLIFIVAKQLIFWGYGVLEWDSLFEEALKIQSVYFIAGLSTAERAV